MLENHTGQRKLYAKVKKDLLANFVDLASFHWKEC